MRKTKWNILLLTLALAFTFLGTRAAAAPQPVGQEQSDASAKKEARQDFNIYRVSYRVNEVENGKTINSRSYTLMERARERASSRVGSRIPIATGQGAQYQYQDVGMNLDCAVAKQEGNLVVHTNIGLSTVQDSERPTSSMSPPVLRHLSLEDDTVATIGKPAFVGSIDDVASNRRYIIEVTVTEAK